MRFPAIALLLILARFTELIESGTVASEIPDLIQSPIIRNWHSGERNQFLIPVINGTMASELGGTMTSEMLNYHWHYISEMPGTTSPKWVAQWGASYLVLDKKMKP